MTLPTYALEVAFGIDPRSDPASGDWVDITQYMKTASIKRGKSQELDAFDPGTMSLELDDPDRRFEPEYSESPYYPDVVPDTHIRLTVSYAATGFDVWRGYVDTWTPRWELPNAATVRCTDAFKYFSTRSFLDNPYSTEVLADSPIVYWDFNKDNAGEGTSLDRSGNGYQGTHVGAVSFEDVGSIGEDKAAFFSGPNLVTGPRISAGSGPAISGTGAFSVEFLWRYDGSDGAGGRLFYQYDGGTGFGVYINIFPVSSSGVVWLNIIEAAGGASLAGTVPINDGNWHHIVCLRETNGTFRIYTDGSLDTSSSPTVRSVVAREIQVGGVPGGGAIRGFIDEFALYHTALSSTRVAAHYAAHAAWDSDLSGARIERVLDYIDWPVGLRDIDTGNTTLQAVGEIVGQKVIEQMKKVEASEFGGLYMTGGGDVRWRERQALSESPYIDAQTVIGRGPGELPYVVIEPSYDDNLIRNEVRLSRDGGVEQVVTDEGSRYFERTYSRAGLQNQTDTELLGVASAILAKDKLPHLGAEVTLNPRGNDDLWPQVLGRELEDAVMVSRIPPETPFTPFTWDVSEWDDDTLWGSAVSKLMRILAINHAIARGFSWKTIWTVVPV